MMMGSSTSQTGSTLFSILEQPGDSQAWGRFVDRYGPKVFHWCRARGLQAADAEDVTQEVLGKFAKAARTFMYDPSKAGFRAWLRTVTKHAWCDAVKDFRRTRGNDDPHAMRVLESIEAGNDLDRELEDEFERELMEQAINAARLRVEPTTWKAFELLVIQGQTGKEVAEQLGLSVAAVYMAKSRVKRLLTAEVRLLERIA